MEFQRFTSPDLAALMIGIVECRGKLADARRAKSDVAIIEHAADLGSMLTTARHEDEALALLLHYLDLARSLQTEEAAGWFLNAYATALQYLDRRDEASLVFGEALDLCRINGWQRLQSFVQQHWGRCLVEQDRLNEAELHFIEALALRIQLNDPRKTSTERALEGLTRLRISGA
jgi:tetratricopeptide (TPR) repeat protein